MEKSFGASSCIYSRGSGAGRSRLSALEVLTCLRRIEAGAKLETAKRALQNCSRILRYAIATGRAESNPAEHLRGALPPHQEGHLAAITTPKEVGELLHAIDAYSGSNVVRPRD
jgi:hypothetical protein